MTNVVAIRLFLVLFAAVTIIIADSLLKKISDRRNFTDAIRDPWMIAVCALYLIQIVFVIFIYIFKGEMAIYTNLFIVFYGIFGIVSGIFLFGETLSLVQIVGIGLGLFGAILMGL
ncbi:MAG: hypothetical protein WCJ25_04920 [Candidatus Moraniibacteriota bacterium]